MFLTISEKEQSTRLNDFRPRTAEWHSGAHVQQHRDYSESPVSMPLSQVLASNATNTNKCKETSGLTGLELRMAYQSLISVKSLLKTVTPTNEVDASDDVQSQENLITIEPDFEETLLKMLEMIAISR